jgi:hypothetical protein
MGHADYLSNGKWNAICDRCGKKYKFSMLKKEWDGLYVCNSCWEPRQPQDYIRGIRDNMSVPISRPEAPNSFLDTIIATVNATATLTYRVFPIKTVFSIICSTYASLLYIITKKPDYSDRVVNGAALNTTTLG